MPTTDFSGPRRLEGRIATQSAFDTFVQECRRRLRLFDIDGRFYGLDRPACVTALRRLLTGTRDASVVVIVHETAYLERDCAGMMALAASFSPRLQLRRTEERLRHVDRGFVLADDVAVLRRPSFHQRFTVLDYDEQAIATAAALFDQLFEQSEPGPQGRITGL